MSPSSPKVLHLARTQQLGCLKPAQESAEIGEQLYRLAVLDRARVQEVQSQMVADEEEPASVRIVNCADPAHVQSSTDFITPVTKLFIG
jgi:hypothetical protein